MTTFSIRFEDRLPEAELSIRASDATSRQKAVRKWRNVAAIGGTTVAALALLAIVGVSFAGSMGGKFNLSSKAEMALGFGGGFGAFALSTVPILGIVKTSIFAQNGSKAIDILNTEKDYTEEEMYRVICTLYDSYYWSGIPENKSTLSNNEKKMLRQIYSKWNDFVIAKIRASDATERGRNSDAKETYAHKMIKYAYVLHNVDLNRQGQPFINHYNFMVNQVNNFEWN